MAARASLVRVVCALALAVAATSVLASGACLPDLAPLPPPVPPNGRDPVTFSGCGDGRIDTLDDGGDGGESCDPGDAQAAGCEGCQFTCAGGKVDDAGHCYFVLGPTSSYQSALNACSGANGHLVTFASDREVLFANALVGSVPYWVGLSVSTALGSEYGPPPGVNEPGWPRSGATCTGCFARGADDAGAFAVKSDVDAAAERLCLVAQDGVWLQVSCGDDKSTTKYTTLCEREPVGERAYPCGNVLCTTLPVTVGAKRYVIFSPGDTAEQAHAFCRKAYDGGSLVTFATREEREQLVREILPSVSPPVTLWIGLSFDGGAWSWDDGVSTTERPLPWGSDQPVGPGVGRAFLRIAGIANNAFDTQLAQSDDGAGAQARRAFVCQRPLE